MQKSSARTSQVWVRYPKTRHMRAEVCRVRVWRAEHERDRRRGTNSLEFCPCECATSTEDELCQGIPDISIVHEWCVGVLHGWYVSKGVHICAPNTHRAS
ncbi:hypothetical protein BD311DRAFT_770431 [Dichomitus squalens]|uniref:Uncharacterized protein n=1 Tax=Dichomitus squalens TaxID=114155 RepID=A0A4Q9M8E7_9APHY|nr:hypothetical protein BD311DRAFT_770431 [Dichomitus squalens]